MVMGNVLSSLLPIVLLYETSIVVINRISHLLTNDKIIV